MKRYNLELNENYTLVDSFYTGPITDGGGTACENCNRIITNVAVVKNSKDQQFNVGLDCAETLSNLHGLNEVASEFAELKALTAKVNKFKKLNQEIIFQIRANGKLYCETNHQTIWCKELEYAEKFLKHYLKLVSNPEKIGFTYTPFVFELPFPKRLAKDHYPNKHSIDLQNDYKTIISTEPYHNRITKEIVGYHFVVMIFHKGNIIHKKEMHMYSQIKASINWGIQQHKFNLFTNKL